MVLLLSLVCFQSCHSPLGPLASILGHSLLQPATFFITAQDLPPLRSLHLQSLQKPNSPQDFQDCKLSWLHRVLLAFFPLPVDATVNAPHLPCQRRVPCKRGSAAVTSRRYPGRAWAGGRAPGCASSGALCPAARRCQRRETGSIFTSLVSTRDGCVPNNPEVLYEQENRYRLQFYGAADNGR